MDKLKFLLQNKATLQSKCKFCSFLGCSNCSIHKEILKIDQLLYSREFLMKELQQACDNCPKEGCCKYCINNAFQNVVVKSKTPLEVETIVKVLPKFIEYPPFCD